jgi:metallo-beta-lactamase family protein
MKGPGIIMAGSGMCTGGRVVDHLKSGIADRKNDILFVGYQAVGTPGRSILKYSKLPGGYVVLEGEKSDIKAKVYQLNGYSAHSDQKELLEWVRSIPEKPSEIRLVHGEPQAQDVLKKKLLRQGNGRAIEVRNQQIA